MSQLRFLPFGLLFVVAGFHCASDRDGFAPDAPGGDGGTANQFGGGDDGGTLGNGSVAARLCSADLQSTLDANGSVKAKCPDDQGCSAGECVPACDAAAASKGSIGCGYVVATPAFIPAIKPPCHAVFLANAWSKSTVIRVSRGGVAYDATKFARTPVEGQPETAWPLLTSAGLQPGEVAVLFLSADPTSANGIFNKLNCKVPTAVPSGTAVANSGKGTAWSISTDIPVTAYDMLPFGGAASFLPSASLLYPATAWGQNYVALLPPEGFRENGPFWGQIVAMANGTTVDVLPTTALAGGGGVTAAPKNVSTKYTLNAGEIVQFQGDGDMTGSVIVSDKPVAFNGGNGYICYKSKSNTSGGGCDSSHQQIPPVSAMGSDYVAAPFASRRTDKAAESIAYRLVGAVDGTTLAYDPPVAGAPTTLGSGASVVFESTSAFRIKSQDAQHPFAIAQMMSGGAVDDATTLVGDEEFVNIVPPAQFLRRYVFMTDPSYATSNLVITRVKTGGTFKDVKIECLGDVTGWKPVGTTGDIEVTNVDLVRNRKSNGSCKNGPQLAESDGSFGVVVWGIDSASSYAYPAGGNVAPINSVVVSTQPK